MPQVKVPHSRLSFGEELDEDEEQAEEGFSLAQSTASRQALRAFFAAKAQVDHLLCHIQVAFCY